MSNEGYEVQFRGDHVHVQLSPEFEFEPNGSHEVWQQIKLHYIGLLTSHLQPECA